jgi:RNA polymerase sigma factor (sigma-70 family)
LDSVTQWIANLKECGHSDDANRLWDRYLDRLLALARRKLGSASRSTADEEDVAVSAFETLLRGIRHDRYAQLNDRHDLWQILVMLTERRAISQRRSELAQKRGGDKTKHPLPDQLHAHEPTPEQALQFAEELDRRLAELPDELERDIAIRRMQGYSNAEIADDLGIGLRTVERKLALIRRTWQ